MSSSESMVDGPIVLGASCGYSASQLRPFLFSLTQSIPDAHVVLFALRRDELGFPGVSVQVPSDTRLRNWVRMLPRGARLFSRLSLHVGRMLEPVLPGATSLSRAAFGVAIARYFWYRDWLQHNPGPSDQPFILSDTRDVVFQGNPFCGLPSGRLFCGEEPLRIADCPCNSDWIRTAYGELKLLPIAEHPVLCSGVIGGPRFLIQDYLDRMCHEILRVGHRIAWAPGYDQGLHNYLIRTTKLGADFCLERWDSDRLTTMHYVSPGEFTFTQDDLLVGPTGRIVSIVHQYDRHADLRSWVDRRWPETSTQIHPTK